MSKHPEATRLNVQALAEAGSELNESILLHKLERLAPESIDKNTENTVDWRAKFELRTGAGGQPDVWLHLHASTCMPLTCQRCMTPVSMPLEVEQWYRFVATEALAMAEDDASEEDLLVIAPQFDLLAVLEDELLMALPLVPMHDVCPVLPVFSAGEAELIEPALAKPNPFAALAQLKKPK